MMQSEYLRQDHDAVQISAPSFMTRSKSLRQVLRCRSNICPGFQDADFSQNYLTMNMHQLYYVFLGAEISASSLMIQSESLRSFNSAG
jgi:hypothetical protein